MEQSQKVLQCLYCGNKTLMNKVAEHRFDESDGEVWYFCISRMYACPVCNKVTFAEEECFSEDCGPWNEDYPIEEILYPVNSFESNYLPKNIKQAYESALKARYIDVAVCLMALRRTLELVCIEKGANGGNLFRKIEILSEKGILPPDLKHASNITKRFGNMGAHENDIRFNMHDVNQIVDFVKYILDYLYVLPAKLKKVQEQLE